MTFNEWLDGKGSLALDLDVSTIGPEGVSDVGDFDLDAEFDIDQDDNMWVVDFFEKEGVAVTWCVDE